MREFLFDVKLLASIRVKAATEADARRLILSRIDCVEANFGAWPNGDPILGEVSVAGKDGGMEPEMLEMVEDEEAG